MKECLEIILSGEVHGVGMRFSAQEKARQLGLVGFVKNLEDGTVQIVAEGEKV